MPIIDFHGKKAIQNYEPPYHILEEVSELDYTSPIEGNSQDNILIEGDNLLALESLLPEYEGKIKCIYIDPPYNTNNKDWVYCKYCNLEQLAPYIYFTEFKSPLVDKSITNKPKVGVEDNTELYLLYKEPNTNTLTEELIIRLNKQSKAKKVIYADKLEFGLDIEFLKDNGIIFKQIPYDILSI